MNKPTPPALSVSQDWWATLEWQAQAWADQCGVRCLWSSDIAPGLLAPQPLLAQALQTILGELLGNVGAHAHASMTEVRLSASHSGITLLVRDNGRGAPPSAFERADALGMAHVRERAAQLGGWLYVESQPGLGTKVILTLPLYQEPPVATLALVAASLFKHPLAGESA